MWTQCKNTAAFTLIELVVVIIIVAILAAVAYPKFIDRTDDARVAAFAQDITVLSDAAIMFYADNGDYPGDYSTGSVGNEGFASYFPQQTFESETPLGGSWDIERNSWGIECSVGVHFFGVAAPSSNLLSRIDEIVDDGDLSSGSFRRFASERYYLIVEQ